MKSKIILSFLLMVILSLTLVNAADLITITKGPVLSETNSQTYFDVTKANSNIVFSITPPLLEINDGKNHYMRITLTQSTNNLTERFTANVVVDPAFIFNIKTYTFPEITLVATDSTNSSIPAETKKVTLDFLKTFCKYGERGTDLSISDIELNNHDRDDTEWMPLDEISIEVEVSNDGTERIRDVAVELGLYDSSGKNIVGDLLDLSDKKIELGSINDGGDKTAIFTFRIPVDFKDANYKLAVKSYSEDVGENTLCVSQSSTLSNTYYESINGERENDEEKQIIVSNIKINPWPVQCGNKVQISADVFNIGDTDYQDQIKVTLYNEDLGVNLEQIIRKDFDEGDSSSVYFEFDVPATAAEKVYSLDFRVYYDYNDSDESYLIGGDKVTKTLIVQGNCEEPVDNTNARITAELDSETPEAVAGKQIIINANLKNTGTIETTYTVSVFGNSAWSSLVLLTPQTITLAPGDSRDIKIVLDLNNDAEGDKEFTIKAVYGNKTTEQHIAIFIEKPILEIEILNPSNNSILKGDFTGLNVKTNKNAVCKYSLSHSINVKNPECEEGKPCPSGYGGGGASRPVEMSQTGGRWHSQLIENLKETINNETQEEKYNIQVTCTDESGNSAEAETTFYVDLTELREMIILEDIGDYEYLKSTMFEIPEGEYDEITTMYLAYYDKSDDDYIYFVGILESQDESYFDDFLEEFDEGISITVEEINGNVVYRLDEGDGDYGLFWFHENLMVYVIAAIHPEPEVISEIPYSLIERYLEKYPSDLMINPSLSLSIIQNLEINSEGQYEGLVKITNTGNVPFENIGNCSNNYIYCGIQFEGPFDWYPNFIESLKPGESQNIKVILKNPSDYNFGETILTMGLNAYYLDGDNEKTIHNSVNLTLIKPEYTIPTIQIISPLDDYSTKSKNINFRYVPSDESNITKCELIIDGQVKETDTSIIKGSENNFDITLSTGNYKWKIKCTDSYGNQGFSDEWDLEIKKSSSRGQSYSYSYEPPSEIKIEEPSLNESLNKVSNEILKEPEIIRLENLKITGEKNNVTEINKSMIFISFIVFALIVFTLFLIVLVIKRIR